MTTENIDFDAQRQALENQIQQLERDRLQAEETRKQSLYSKVTEFENEAANYRAEATIAINDEAKKDLYRYAAYYEKEANELRKALGIDYKEEIEQSEVYQREQRLLTLKRKVNSLLVKAFMSLVAYLLSDFLAGSLDAGFFSFALNIGAQFTWFITLGFSLCWVVGSLMLGILSEHVLSVSDDYLQASGSTRLLLVVALVIGLLLSLSQILPHGK